MTEKEGIGKKFKFFRAWSIIATVIIVILAISVYFLDSRVDYYRESYDYSCDEGTERKCITTGSSYREYKEGESAIIIKEDETYKICNADRKEKAVCVSEEGSWTQCDEDEWAYCIDKDRDWRSCDVGEQAKCLEENIASTVSSSGFVNKCEIGESAACINWDKQFISNR